MNVKEAELKISVQSWGGSPVFVATANGKEITTSYSLEKLINAIDELADDPHDITFKYNSDIWKKGDDADES